MTSESREVSIQDGEPLELYEFMVYGQKYRYASCIDNYLFDSHTYAGSTLEHTPFEETNEIPKNNITITCPHNFEMMGFYDGSPPSDVILLTIFQTHRGESNAMAVWTGRVMNGRRKGIKGELFCENVFTSLRRAGLRRHYGRLCPHVLYGPKCKAPEAGFKVETLLDSSAGLTVVASILDTYDDGRFAGGLLEVEISAGRTERRAIKSHVGSTVEITHPLPELPVSAIVTFLPGCKHNVPDCDGFFGNILNYGGLPFSPRQNPMGQSSVF